MKMNKTIIVLTLFVTALTIAACNKEKEDPTDNGVPTNTLIAGGISIPVSSVVCSEVGSGDDLVLTASDLTQENILYIRFILQRPTVTTTVALSPSGSGSEAFGTYTVNGNLEYEIQSGTATITPSTNNSLTITFNDVVAETGNNVSVNLSFNGVCN